MKTLITVIIEMIPGGIGPYGIGDIVTFIEALFGRTLDGLILRGSERMIYFIASLIPVVPARPIIGFYRQLTKRGDPSGSRYSLPAGQSPPGSPYGLPSAQATFMAKPAPKTRSAFLLIALGGVAALVAYVALPYATVSATASDAQTQTLLKTACGNCTQSFVAMDINSISNGPWLLLVLGGLLAVMGLLGAIRNREHGLLMRSFASLVAIAGGGFGLVVLFQVWRDLQSLHISADIASMLHTAGVRTEFGTALGFWVMVAGIGAGLVGGWITSHKLHG